MEEFAAFDLVQMQVRASAPLGGPPTYIATVTFQPRGIMGDTHAATLPVTVTAASEEQILPMARERLQSLILALGRCPPPT